MNGSPAKLGTIQGTSGHASALKQTKSDKAKAKAKDEDIAHLKKKLEEERAKSLKLQIAADKAFIEKEASKITTEKVSEKIAEDKAKTSEKTKNLRRDVAKADEDVELTNIEREKAEKKEGKYGKGLFGGHFRRKKAKRKHKRASEKEDRTREQLAKSEAYDQLTIEQKEAKRREKQAYLTARFNDDARAMYAISQGKEIKAKKKENEYDANLPTLPSFTIDPHTQTSAFQEIQQKKRQKKGIWKDLNPVSKDIESFRKKYKINVNE